MEFCTRSPDPSTPFLGFVAAASGHVQERIERQLKAQAFLFIPVNCKTQWSLEAELRNGHPGANGRVWRMFLSMGACLRHDSRYIRDDR
ncbi:uncharacterized protein C8R40DRAFT_505085 [Lentinula edodes]|uniref:uncharacterized protein n=1 Tax=Lentinula edodes TaxID=5353 RepID=UPI001E8EE112|nr:uncharacterized protein C8R40DRAFT_505085 [Lentinula edodes]KAH7872127.1 hypothetical protein C8R40DRAFT_505085 [Lentinula edodes]